MAAQSNRTMAKKMVDRGCFRTGLQRGATPYTMHRLRGRRRWCQNTRRGPFRGIKKNKNNRTADADVLTLPLVVNATLRLRLELGADLVQQLVQALAGGASRRDAARRRVAVIHGDGARARGQTTTTTTTTTASAMAMGQMAAGGRGSGVRRRSVSWAGRRQSWAPNGEAEAARGYEAE